jgi:ABC-type phosphate transport system substrate-binding protein
MCRRSLFHCAALILGLLTTGAVEAETVVIMATSSAVTQVSRDEVINIFTGRYRRLANGTAVIPVEPGIDSPVRRAFYKSLLGKTVSEMRAYWARLIFSGRTTPPEEFSTDAEVVERVAKDPALIGYVDRQSLTSRVRVVYVLPESLP